MKARDAIIASGAVAAAGVVAALALRWRLDALNAEVRAAIADERPPSFFKDLGWREMDALVLGSTEAWMALERRGEESGVYPLVFFECGAWVQYSLLRCYFGHLRRGGEVVVVLDPHDATPERAVSPLDAATVHELLFRAEGGGLSEAQTQSPALYAPLWSRRFLRARKARRAGEGAARAWRGTAGAFEPSGYLACMASFCAERDLALRAVVLGPEDGALASRLEAAGVSQVVFATDADELNACVYGA